MNRRVTVISIASLIIVLIIMFEFPVKVYRIVLDIFNLLTHDLGVFYILTVFASLVFVIVFTRKNGSKILGKEGIKKKYSELAWASMMFCTGIGGSMLLFAFIEPLYYLKDCPFEIEPMSQEAFEYAHMYGQFHWGILDWILCVPLTLFIAINIYIKKHKYRTLGGILSNRENKKNIFSDIIDVFCVFAIIGGAATSMGLSAPVICKIVSMQIGKISEKNALILIFIVWFIIYATSVWKGLERGIKKLSNLNICMALIFVAVVFLIVNPLDVVSTEINSIGLMSQNFLRMSLYTAPFEKAGFPQRWTVFYWALTLAYTPGLALFTARISEGRTIKQMVYGMVFYGSLGTMFCFSTLGLYSLVLQKTGAIDVANILANQGKEAAIVAILSTLPVHRFFEIFFAIICLIFMATTIDSSVYVIASITSDNGTIERKDPPKTHRVLWAVLMLLFSGMLTRIGGLETMQTSSIITALPIIVINIIAIVKMLRDKELY